MPPLISVIIPCFNQAAYLEAAVASVLAQRYSETEIVIINDGSTDETAEAAERLARQAPAKIHVIHQENQGLAMARQAGLEALKGDCFVMLDADDLLEPGMFSACLAALERQPEADGAVGEALLFEEGWPGGERVLRPRLPLGWPGVLESNPIGACHSALLHTASVRRIGGLGLAGVRACEDWDLWVRMARCRMNLVAVPEVVCRYRQHAGVLSRRTALMLEEKIKLFERCMTEDPRLGRAGVAPQPPIPARLGQELRNGAVFHAVGYAAGSGAAETETDVLLQHLAPGGFAFRASCNQFLWGLDAACRQQATTGPRPEAAIACLCTQIKARMTQCGHRAYSGAVLREVRRELRHPGKKKSLRRRLSRWLDPLRALLNPA